MLICGINVELTNKMFVSDEIMSDFKDLRA